jgi:hypothetical protein
MQKNNLHAIPQTIKRFYRLDFIILATSAQYFGLIHIRGINCVSNETVSILQPIVTEYELKYLKIKRLYAPAVLHFLSFR